jgi:hypothetical protein
MADLIYRDVEVTRYAQRAEFNPDSNDQIRALMRKMGVVTRPGHKAKTEKGTVDKEVIERLARRNSFFESLSKYRKANKLHSTYVQALAAALNSAYDRRLHPLWTHNPSTWRMSCYNPNMQNWPNDEEDPMTPALRRCVIASPGCELVSADFSSIEAVETGWWARDPNYIRLATRGVHSYLVAHKVGEPISLSLPDDELAAALADIKKRYKTTPVYFGMKKTVHLTNYGGNPFMMYKAAPKLFPSIAIAEASQQFYLDLLPALPVWHKEVRQKAAEQNFLGGKDHPWRFKHWFWDVLQYDPKKNGMVPGSDWNKVIAYYPQSSTAGILYDTVLDLHDPESPNFVGDMKDGDTPLIALIHDEILADVPKKRRDEFCEKLTHSMTREIRLQKLDPRWSMGEYLRIATEVRVGPSWADMEPWKESHEA